MTFVALFTTEVVVSAAAWVALAVVAVAAWTTTRSKGSLFMFLGSAALALPPVAYLFDLGFDTLLFWAIGPVALLIGYFLTVRHGVAGGGISSSGLRPLSSSGSRDTPAPAAEGSRSRR